MKPGAVKGDASLAGQEIEQLAIERLESVAFLRQQTEQGDYTDDRTVDGEGDAGQAFLLSAQRDGLGALFLARVGAQGRVTCNGCTIILSNSSASSTATIGDVDINGGAQINMTAPSGGTYEDILFYQDRRAASGTNTVNKINGNSSSTFSGAMYFPNQVLEVNGNSGLNFSCAQFVSRRVEFSGNGSITNTCPGGYGDGSIMGKHVRLVA